MSPEDRFHELFLEAYDLQPSAVSVTLAEEAVRIADAHLSMEHRFWARTNLIQFCFASGQPLPMLVAIAWSLAIVDRQEYDPDPEDLGILLWQCKHAVTYSSSFSTISYEQFSKLFADVLRRYQSAGASPRSVYMIGSSSELYMGHLETADDCIEKGRAAPRDEFAESQPWELFFEVDHLVTRDLHAEALEKLRPMLDNPHRAEDVDPWFVSYSMFELLRQGKRDEAMRHHRRAIKKISGNSKFVCQIARHVAFLSVVDQNEKALKLLEQHLEIGMSGPDQGSRMEFCLYGWVLIRRLIDSGRKTLKIRFPDLESLSSPEGARVEPPEATGEEGTYDLETLADWLRKDYLQLSEDFNDRNGNRFLDKTIKNATELIGWNY